MRSTKITRFLGLLCFAFLAPAQTIGLFQNHGDVGATPKSGSASFDAATGEYKVTGGGANMWAEKDAFQYVWKQVSGDVTLTADVHFLGSGAVGHRKAALVVRQSLEPGSAYADVALHGDGLTSLQFRPANGAITDEARSALKGPVRIRIERRGNRFTLSAGSPDADLLSTGPVTVALSDPVYVGLGVCSHDANVLETAVFSNVKVETRPRTEADSLAKIADDFWKWRAVFQPFSSDDIPRIERPADALSDWSTAAIEARRKALNTFETRWRRVGPDAAPVSQQVDYRLMGSAFARVRWELDVERAWLRNPRFYYDQTVGSVFDALTQPPPFSDERAGIIVRRMGRIPRTIKDGEDNLERGGAMARPFAMLAIEELKDIGPRLQRAVESLTPLMPGKTPAELKTAADQAIAALEGYREWLNKRLPAMETKTAVGRDAYLFFLRNVALMPFTPEELLAMGRQEWERSVSFEAYEKARNQGQPELAMFPGAAAQIAKERDDEASVRQYMMEKHILTVPEWMGHYRNLPVPVYLEALGAGVTDDLTGPSRLKSDATSYTRPPSPQLGYFALATAHDPRPILVHEGVPGHFFQLALSWANEDPIRRHFYDSGANEGIGFYAEEMMLQAGYFDDRPRVREIIYNFMRLRALRVEVDVKLALGIFNRDTAAEYLEKTVPMDHRTALQEAADFASWPGQAISYQIGKIQIMRMLADSRRKQGARFDLQKFHDFVWTNGNVPIALQQWELLNDPSNVPPATK